MQEIQLREAKTTPSAVIDRARQGEPSVVTRHGHPDSVVLSFEEWQRLSQVPSFGRLLIAAPLEPNDLPPRQDGLRDAGFSALYLVVLSTGAPAKAVAMPALMDWMHRNSARLFLSVIAVAEVEDGIAKSRRLGAHRKAERLSEWLETVLHLYGARVLPIDLETARRIGVLSDLARGQAPGLADIAIAATAQTHEYTILTRNLRQFGPLGVSAIDPYETITE